MKIVVSNNVHHKQVSLVLRTPPHLSPAQVERARASLCPGGPDCSCGGGVLNQAGPEAIKDLEGTLYDAVEKKGKVKVIKLES